MPVRAGGVKLEAPRSERSEDAFCEAEPRLAVQALHIAESAMAHRARFARFKLSPFGIMRETSPVSRRDLLCE